MRLSGKSLWLCAHEGKVTAPSIHQIRPLMKTRMQLWDAVGQVRWCWANISVFFNSREHQNKKDSTQGFRWLHTKMCSWIPAREETLRQNQKTAMLHQHKQSFICFRRFSHNKHENKPRKTDNLTLPLSAYHTRLE